MLRKTLMSHSKLSALTSIASYFALYLLLYDDNDAMMCTMVTMAVMMTVEVLRSQKGGAPL